MAGQEALGNRRRNHLQGFTGKFLTKDAELGPKAARAQQMRDRELQAEGLLIVQPTRSEVWTDPVGVAEEALRTLVESTRFESEAAAASQEGR